MRKIASLLLVLTCTVPTYVWAQSVESELPSDSRIKWLMYDETDVYTINTRYGYQTNIVFAPEEEIQTISVGDRSLWQIIPAGNRLFIRPLDEEMKTNMTVITNRRSYQFDLKALPVDSDGKIIYVAKFVYPARGAKRPVEIVSAQQPAPAPTVVAAPAPAPAIISQPAPQPVMETPPPAPMPAPTGKKNLSYTYSGTDALAPVQVYDDSQSTFIKVRDPKQPFPDPYVVDARRNERPLDYRVEGDTMVIDRVVGELELKNSQGTVNIYNEILNPR